MAKVPKEAKTAGHPQLRPEHAGGADLVVVTIAGVTLKPSQFRETEQPVLTFEDFPEHELRLGKRATQRMCEQFGDDTDAWEGERIPLVKGREEVGSKTYVVYQVPPTEEWSALLKQAKAKKGSRGK